MHMDKITLHANMPQLPLDSYWFQSVPDSAWASSSVDLADFFLIQNPVLIHSTPQIVMLDMVMRVKEQIT